jgi:hypothetical protein
MGTVPSGRTPVGAVRRMAFDRTPPPAEALGRIRDAYHDYDKQGGISESYDELEA